MIAITIAIAMIARITVPKAWPDICSSRAPFRSLALDRLEPAGLFRERTFRWQTLHGACAVEVMAVPGPPEDEFGILRLGDRTAMDKYDDITPDAQRRLRPLIDKGRRLIKAERGMSPDRPSGGEPEMADDDIGPRPRHRQGVLGREDI